MPPLALAGILSVYAAVSRFAMGWLIPWEPPGGTKGTLEILSLTGVLVFAAIVCLRVFFTDIKIRNFENRTWAVSLVRPVQSRQIAEVFPRSRS